QSPPPLDGVPPRLAAVVARLLAKRPEDRFASAADVAAALAAGGDGAAPPHQTASWFDRTSPLAAGAPRPARFGRPAFLWGAAAALAAGGVAAWASLRRRRSGEPPSDAPDADVLTVSQDAGGGGRFRELAAALAEVRPGQTIRVLDDAVY